MRRCGVAPPPPPIIFERLQLPRQIIYRQKGNLSESPSHLKYRENILISRFYKQFSRSSWNLNIYIILKRLIWRFQMYNLFREIFKLRDDETNNIFREILKCFRKTGKFEFFAKLIIYLGSPDQPASK